MFFGKEIVFLLSLARSEATTADLDIHQKRKPGNLNVTIENFLFWKTSNRIQLVLRYTNFASGWKRTTAGVDLLLLTYIPTEE